MSLIIRFHRYYCSFPAVSSVVVLALALLLCGLSYWQWCRAAQKRALLRDYAHRQHAPAEALFVDAPNYQRVVAQGVFLNPYSFLLENQFHAHRLGYDVLTPLQVQRRIVLVDRGFIPASASALPDIPAVKGKIRITGTVYKPRHNPFIQSRIENPGHWPALVAQFDFVRLSRILKRPLYPFILRLDADQAHGFVRAWQVTTFPPARHIAYALQWLGLALVLFIGFVVLHTHRRGSS